MASRKNTLSEDKVSEDTSLFSTTGLQKLALAEDIIIGLIMASALFIFSTRLNSHFTLPKLAIFACLTAALLVVFLARLKSGHYQVLPKIIRFPLLLLVIWWLLGTSQAIHMQTALEGQYGRYNGLYTNLLLVTLFVVVSSIPYDVVRFRRFLSWLFFLMLIVCLYAFIQYMGFDTVFGKKTGARPPSSIGNPVALATILLLTLPYVVAEAWLRKKRNQRITTTLVFLILLFVLIISGSRGPWVAVSAQLFIGFSVLLLVINASIVSKIKALLLVLILFVVIAVLLVGISGLYSRLLPGLGFEMRLNYFNVAWQMIQDSPLFGFGFESFRLAYPIYRPIHDALFYKRTIVTPTMVHNDYLQLSADNGIPAMLFYLFLVGGILWLIIRTINRDKQYRLLHIAILVMLSGYLVQGLSGWMEAASSIMFWVVLAVSTSFVLQRSGVANAGNRSSAYIYTVILGAGLFIAIGYAVIMLTKVRQDYILREAQHYSRLDYIRTDAHLKWLGQSSHDNAYYQDQIGIIYMQRLKRRPSPQIYQLARRYLLRARELNTYDPYIRLHTIGTDSIALRHRLIDKPSVEVAIDMSEILRMDPNNPTVYQVRAELYTATGNQQAARKNIARMRQIRGSQK